MDKKILVIENDYDIAARIIFNLKREGFSMLYCHSGSSGLSLAKAELPDLVLLNYLLPDGDGVELCSRLKSTLDMQFSSVIVISTRQTEKDIVDALSRGADDFISLPFRPRELVARVKAVLRSRTATTAAAHANPLKFADFEIDKRKFKVSVEGREIKLTLTEFYLLSHLAQHQGQVLTRTELLGCLTRDSDMGSRNVDVHIRSIRKKLAVEPSYIETVRGIGYRFKGA